MSHLGCGDFSANASANSLKYVRDLDRRLQQETFEEIHAQNERYFQEERIIRAIQREQAREQYQTQVAVRQPTAAQLKQLVAKFNKS